MSVIDLENTMILQSESWAIFLHISETPEFLLGKYRCWHSLGVEPRSSVPETNVLSIELQEVILYTG